MEVVMSTPASIALLILRIALGIIFIAHGSQKSFGAFGGPGIKGFSGMVQGLGLNPPVLWAWAAALSEFFGGLLLLAGVLPRIGAFLIACVMVVAIARVHWAKGFFIMQGGFEYPFLILMVCIALMITGAGEYSFFDRF